MEDPTINTGLVDSRTSAPSVERSSYLGTQSPPPVGQGQSVLPPVANHSYGQHVEAHPATWNYYAAQYPHNFHPPNYPHPTYPHPPSHTAQHPHPSYPHPMLPQQSGGIPSIHPHVATPIYGASPHAFRGYPPPQMPHVSHVPASVPYGTSASITGHATPSSSPTSAPQPAVANANVANANVAPVAFDILDEEAPDLSLFFNDPQPEPTHAPPATNVETEAPPSNTVSVLPQNGSTEEPSDPASRTPEQGDDVDARINGDNELVNLESADDSESQGSGKGGQGVRQRPSLANPVFGMVKGAGRGSRPASFYRTRKKKAIFTDTSKGCKYYNVAIHDLFTRCEDFSRRTRCWLHIAVQHPSSTTPFAHYTSQKLREAPEGAMDGLHGQASKVMSNLLRAERKAKTALQTELTEANETAKEATEKLVEAQAKLAKVNAFLASSGIAFDDTASSA
ncbi:hypothetical protein FA13DRAFT_1713558 [Coprinellus micaceus]|uniref:Uncharacterized protein n=1 Tax=Coprinellus micaceus TaxID=71717 RepID=A0A4Y7SW93_COPMI|nr:hypothetical protein FA13DRAFT_1713558 [Coprinellus micaceus]